MDVLLRLGQEGDIELPRFLRLKAAELARVADEARHPAVAARLRAMAAHYLARAQYVDSGDAPDGGGAGSEAAGGRPRLEVA
jgi:hypothetical protein